MKLGLLCLLGLTVNVAWAQPANDNFTNAFVIAGFSGATNGVNNTTATMEACEPTPVLCHRVWS